MEIYCEIAEWSCEYCTASNSESYLVCSACGGESSQYHFDLDHDQINEYITNKPNRKARLFGSQSKVFFPVLHPKSEEQMEINIAILKTQKPTHIALISNECTSAFLVNSAKKVKAALPYAFLLLNFVGESVYSLFKYLPQISGTVDGIMLDNCMIYQNSDNSDSILKLFIKHMIRAGMNEVVLFGGLYFKYQPHNGDYDVVLPRANHILDIICTSGNATGIAADSAKVKTIKSKTSVPVALCSGITNENIVEMTNIVDVLMVGTFINDATEKINETNYLTLMQLFNSNR